MNSGEPLPRRKELGPYRLGPLLGEGGMGKVYKAFDTRLRRWVAVKSLRGDAPREARERFQREARTLAQLGHPGIVQIFDIVEDADGDWIVMELIDGFTLAELRPLGRSTWGSPSTTPARSPRPSKLPTTTASSTGISKPKRHGAALGACEGTRFWLAHRVTPLSNEPTAVEGMAALEEPFSSESGRIAGTPRAMAPEQAMGRAVDERSDLFSLGVLLYELLAARPAFKARTAKRPCSRC